MMGKYISLGESIWLPPISKYNYLQKVTGFKGLLFVYKSKTFLMFIQAQGKKFRGQNILNVVSKGVLKGHKKNILR